MRSIIRRDVVNILESDRVRDVIDRMGSGEINIKTRPVEALEHQWPFIGAHEVSKKWNPFHLSILAIIHHLTDSREGHRREQVRVHTHTYAHANTLTRIQDTAYTNICTHNIQHTPRLGVVEEDD